MKRNDQKRYLTAALGVIAVALMFFFIYQQVVSLKAAQEQAALAESALAQADSQLHSLEKLRDQALDFQKQLNKMDQVMPAEPLEDQLIKDLQMKASDNYLQLTSVHFEEYQDKKDYEEMPLTLAMEGQYQDLLGFLKDIQQGPRAILVREIRITKVEQDLPLIKIDITACTFYTKN